MRLPGLQITCRQKGKLEFDAIQARNSQRHSNYHSISPATLSRATWQVLAFFPVVTSYRASHIVVSLG